MLRVEWTVAQAGSVAGHWGYSDDWPALSLLTVEPIVGENGCRLQARRRPLRYNGHARNDRMKP